MDDDEDVVCRYGTPLEPLTEESPQVKAVTVSDQIVVDENGKRRFHGAFTGGFSAGFWNTVGSLEGWTPQSFKSSRKSKATYSSQAPEQFMDDEDLGEFGIAPQRVQSTEKFRKIRDERKELFSEIFDMNMTVEQSKENVGKQLLKKMGWRPGQGVGARLTRIKKKSARRRNVEEQSDMKRYGCDMGPLTSIDISDEDETDSDDSITFAPDDFDLLLHGVKDNRFGLGYKGLHESVAQFNRKSGTFEVMGKNNKKLSIRGQAFGVGAFEEEDEDIYSKEDMSNYDFDLNEKEKSIKKKKKQDSLRYYKILTGFTSSDGANKKKEKRIFMVNLPRSFQPRNWEKRKTRFEPISEEIVKKIKVTNVEIDRKETNKKWDKRDMKRVIPNEQNDDRTKPTESFKERLMSNKFVASAILDESGERPIEIQPEITPTTNSAISKYLDDDRFQTAKDDMVIQIKEEETKIPVNDIKIIKCVRTKVIWTPSNIVCKRFNVNPPRAELDEVKEKPKKNFILFDYLPGKDPLPKIKDLQQVEEIKLKPLDDAIPSTTCIDPVPGPSRIIPTQKPVSSSSSNLSRLPQTTVIPQKPKNELEQRIVDLKGEHPSGKKDLFKSIFEDSSDSENEEVDKTSNVEISKTVVSENDTITLATDKMNTTNAGIINNVLNMPKPEGIFSNIYDIINEDRVRIKFTKPDTLKEKMSLDEPPKKTNDTPQPVLNPDVYGPSLPQSLSQATSLLPVELPTQSDSKRILKTNINNESVVIVEEWIEKKPKHKEKKRKKDKKKKKKKHK